MAEICPDCEIEMKEGVKKCFGNPINIGVEVPIEVCPKCGFSVVSEEHIETIKRALKKKC